MMIKVRKILIYYNTAIPPPFLYSNDWNLVQNSAEFPLSISCPNLATNTLFCQQGKNTGIVFGFMSRQNFEPHNSLKPSFNNIQGVCFNFVRCRYFLKPNYPDILAWCERNLDDLIDSSYVSVAGYLPLNWKYPYSCAWSCNLNFLFLFLTSFT